MVAERFERRLPEIPDPVLDRGGPGKTELAPGEYIVFDAGHWVGPAGDRQLLSDPVTEFGGSGPQDFTLDGARGGQVWLLAADAAGNPTQFVDHIEFGAAASGESLGRWPDGQGGLYPLTDWTPAAVNSEPRVGPVIISEIMYHPSPPTPGDRAIYAALTEDDLEYVEIFNNSPQDLDLTGWRLRPDIEFDFAPGTTLPAGKALVVLSFDPLATGGQGQPLNAQRTTAFRNHYGLAASVTLVGAYSGRLDDLAQQVCLERPDEPPPDEPSFVPHLREDEVPYQDRPPWPTGPDGSGESLHRRAVDLWGPDAGNWIAAAATPGAVAQPAAEDDPASTQQGTRVDIDVLHNDGAAGGPLDPASVRITAAPANGWAVADPVTGLVTYRPAGSFTGVVTFEYRVANALGFLSTPATVTVTVNNALPTAEAAGPYAGHSGIPFTLVGIGTDPGHDLTLFQWDFDGDGTYDYSSPAGGTVDHAYPAAGVYQARFRVTDAHGASRSDTAQVTVSDVAGPVADAGGPYAGGEGQPIGFLAGGTAAGPGLVLYEWDFDGDGNFDFSSASAGWTDHVFPASGTYAATLRVTDSSGAGDIDTVEVSVLNAPPTADAAGPYAADEASPVTLFGTGTDAGGDLVLYEWDFDGDGLFDHASLSGGTVSHVYPRSGVYAAAFRVTDADGASHTDTAQVTIHNLPPTAHTGGPHAGNEGDTLVLDGDGFDPGGDIRLYQWDFDGDGVYDYTSAVSARVAHTYTASGHFAATLRVTDGGGDSGTAIAQVTISNRGPTADAGGPYTVGEGGTVIVDASRSTDPGDDIVLYEWDFDGDGQYDDATGMTPGFHAGNDGQYPVRLRVTDDQLVRSTSSATVTVTNLPPTARAGGPYVGSEGSTLTLDATTSSDPASDIVLYEWDFDGDGQYDDAAGVKVKFSSTVDGVYTVGLRVTDDRGAQGTSTATILLFNVTPTAEAGGPYYVLPGGTVTVTASASRDPGNDIVSYLWDLDRDGQYDDATGPTVLFQAGTNPTYTIGVRVTDDDGARHSDTAIVNVTATNVLVNTTLTLAPPPSTTR